MRLSYYGTRGYVVECTHSHYLLPFWQDEMLEYIITIIILLVTKLESCWVPFNDLDLNNASNIYLKMHFSPECIIVICGITDEKRMKRYDE